MDSLENANIQTIEQPAKSEVKLKAADEAPKQAPIAPKPKPTYKCLVCGKS